MITVGRSGPECRGVTVNDSGRDIAVPRTVDLCRQRGATGGAGPHPGVVLHDHTGTSRSAPAPRGDLGSSALVLGALGVLSVAVASGLATGTPLTVAGLALVSAGIVLAGGGLVLGTIAAIRGRPGANRAAITAAGLSVVGLAGGLIWLAAFVITALAGPAGTVPEIPACVPPSCHSHH